MTPRITWGRPASRGAAVVLLALLVAAVVDARPPAAAQPDKKEPEKKEPEKKEPDKKEPEFVWPTEINGKDIHAVVKNLDDSDPVVREFAATMLPSFGPPAQKGEASKALVKRMKEEKDPGVRIAVFTAVGKLQFENEGDNQEALRILAQVIDTGVPGGLGRLHAIQTVTMFGAKGERAITALTGVAMNDPAYTTRQNIAIALGRVGFSETTGPNMKALTALADKLSTDPSAAVRMEATQSLMLLGPPWAAVKKPAHFTLTTQAMKDLKEALVPAPVLAKLGAVPNKGAQRVEFERDVGKVLTADEWNKFGELITIHSRVPEPDPPIDTKAASSIIRLMRVRIGDPKTKPPTRGEEKDKQVEIWARVVLMRFDPNEVNDENLDAIARYLSGSEIGVKLQALSAIKLVGEGAARKLPDVVRVMEAKDATNETLVASITAVAAMGAGAKPALPNLKKLLEEKKKAHTAKELELAKKKEDVQLTGEEFALKEIVKLIETAISIVEKAKEKEKDKDKDKDKNATQKADPAKKP